MSLNLSLKLQRLRKRYGVVTITLFLFVAVLLTYNIKHQSDILLSQRKILDIERETDRLLHLKKALQEGKKENPTLKVSWQDLLPPEQTSIELTEDLLKKAGLYKLKDLKYNFKGIEDCIIGEVLCIRVPLHLKGKGSYTNIRRFLSAFTEGNNLVLIDSLKLSEGNKDVVMAAKISLYFTPTM